MDTIGENIGTEVERRGNLLEENPLDANPFGPNTSINDMFDSTTAGGWEDNGECECQKN